MNKKKLYIILIITIIIVSAIIILNLCFKNKNKEVTCESMNKNLIIYFKNNKVDYIKGTEKLDEISEENKLNLEISLVPYSNLISYDEDNNEINFSILYKEENKDALAYVGFSFNDSPKYKDVIKRLEFNNYYCKQN